MLKGSAAYGEPIRDGVRLASRRGLDGDDSNPTNGPSGERTGPVAAGSASERVRRLARVLVVDDDEGVRRQLCYLLEDEGYVVEAAATGQAAIAAARVASFDVVILDVRLPDLSGIEVFETFRKGCASIRTIIVSGFLVDEEIAAAEGRGAHFLAKPVDAGRLLQLMAQLEQSVGDAS